MITLWTEADTDGNTHTFAKPAELFNDPQNPREITEDKFSNLISFLDEYGQLLPLLVDNRPETRGKLIGGNMTYRAATEGLHWEKVWIELRTPKSDADAFQMATIHNMKFGRYVKDAVAELAEKYKEEIALPDLDISVIDDESLDKIIKEYGPGDEQASLTDDQLMSFQVVVECTNEIEMREYYDKLQSLGIPAKMLSR